MTTPIFPAHIKQLIDVVNQQFADQDYEATIESCRKLASVWTDSHEPHYLMAISFDQLKRPKDAYECQMRVLELMPDNALFHFNAGVYADAMGDQLRSMVHYQRCLHIDPNNTDALWNYSEHLRLDGHIEMAIELLERLKSLGKDDTPMFYNRLVAAYEISGQYDKEILDIYHNRLLKNTDGLVLSRWGYALHQLTHEHFEVGFQYYNRRFEAQQINNAYCHPFPHPLLEGTLKHGDIVLAHGEQGLGDEMMFMSCMNELIAEANAVGAKIIIGCKRPLVRLAALSFPDAFVRYSEYNYPAPEFDNIAITHQIPLGHLLERYRKNHDDFDKNRKPYFKADPNRAAHFEQRIQIMGRQSIDGKRRMRVGLMWGTVSTEKVQRFVRFANRKSIPLAFFDGYADLLDDVEFVSLQNAERGAEVALVPELKILDFSTEQADFYDTVALMSTLDLVLTIDTSVAHAAGGLGIETWVPLPAKPDWRYGLHRDVSYWYDKTRHFRQTKKDFWHNVLDQMHDELRVKASQFSTQSV